MLFSRRVRQGANTCYDADIVNDGLVTLGLFVALGVRFYFFIFRGRQRGFEALASRALQLRQDGVGTVYYLCSNSFMGDNSLPIGSGSGIGALLNTGYLAYEQDGALKIEYPWWNVMRLFQCYRPGTLNLHLRNEYRASRPKPGIYIDDRTYVVAGLNIADAKQARRLWRLKDVKALEANRQIMAEHLMRTGFRFTGY